MFFYWVSWVCVENGLLKLVWFGGKIHERFFIFFNEFYFSDCSSTVDLLIEYFKRFGDKTCCFWDLAPYLYLNLQEMSEREKVTRHWWNTCTDIRHTHKQKAQLMATLTKLHLNFHTNPLRIHSILEHFQGVWLRMFFCL